MASKLFVQARNAYRKAHWQELQGEAKDFPQCAAAVVHERCHEESFRCRECSKAFKEEARRFIDKEALDRFMALSLGEQLALVPGILPALQYRARRARIVAGIGSEQACLEAIPVSTPAASISDASVAEPATAIAHAAHEVVAGDISADTSKAVFRLEAALGGLAGDIVDGRVRLNNSASTLLASEGVLSVVKLVRDHAVMVARRDLKADAEKSLKANGIEKNSEVRKAILQHVRDKVREWVLTDDPDYEYYLFVAAVEKGFPFDDSLRKLHRPRIQCQGHLQHDDPQRQAQDRDQQELAEGAAEPDVTTPAKQTQVISSSSLGLSRSPFPNGKKCSHRQSCAAGSACAAAKQLSISWRMRIQRLLGVRPS